MANVYFGDGVSAPVSSPANWTDAGNWYSTPGTQASGCCGSVAGTPLGHLPAITDNVFVQGFNAGSGNVNANGPPVTAHTGPVTIYSAAFNGSPITFISGKFAGSFTTDVILLKISGGTYSGAVTFGAASGFPGPIITGGTFTGSVALLAGGSYVRGTTITGGTYSPTATLALTAGGALNPAGFPNDPGFAAGGATFSPTVNITGNVYPAVTDVASGKTYGPTGANFTGTLVAGSSVSAAHTTGRPLNLRAQFRGVETEAEKRARRIAQGIERAVEAVREETAAIVAEPDTRDVDVAARLAADVQRLHLEAEQLRTQVAQTERAKSRKVALQKTVRLQATIRELEAKETAAAMALEELDIMFVAATLAAA